MNVRATGLVPFNMCSFQGNDDLPNPNVETAHRTLILVSRENFVSELRVTLLARNGFACYRQI